MPRIILENFRILDETTDGPGSVVLEDGLIRDLIPGPAPRSSGGALVIDGRRWASNESLILMPALVDLHAHFRDPGGLSKENLESAALAAAAGGYGTLVCMANTSPVIDTAEKAAALKARADRLGLIDLYPALSLTMDMEGQKLSGITALPQPAYTPRLLSEDGKDVARYGTFLAALTEARRLGLPVSCHCDAGGPEAEAAKMAGQGRSVWSRLEENNGVRRAIGLGMRAGGHVHIAHVSTAEAVELIRQAKAALQEGRDQAVPFTLTCEAAPHHIALTEETALALGEETFGRVNPPLRTGEDRQALIAGLLDGTIDAIATDHAPHTIENKSSGSPGFSGLETAFGVCFTELVQGEGGGLALRRLSALMSAAPARILGLGGDGPLGRGRIAAGLRADLAVARVGSPWTVEPDQFKSRGRNSPFGGRNLFGQILLTI
ncbi:MAG: amidohydrolase family protein, partial [Treponema sp.]|nr:amidohydrolase family protein [Treponema sp.]